MSGTGILAHHIADHKPIFVSRKVNFASKSGLKTQQFIEYTNWKIVDKQEMISMTDIMFDGFNPTDIEAQSVVFTHRIHCLIDQFLPKKCKRVKDLPVLPFINSEVRRLTRRRDAIKMKFDSMKRSGFVSSDLWSQFKGLRNKVNILLRKLRKDWYKNQIEENRGNSRRLWKVISNVVETKKSKKTKNSVLNLNINELNNHFVGSATSTPNTTTNVLHYNFDTNLVFNEVTEEKVESLLNKLDINKSVGSDGISTKVIKIIAPSLVKTTTTLICQSFIEGTFPSIWKRARIRALWKGGDRSSLGNYRPISILPVITKVIERVVYDELSNHLKNNSILNDNQMGFRSNHSCVDAMAVLLNSIHKQLKCKKKVCVIALDIQKAFDSVDHNLLISKLRSIGCSENVIKWFESYLSQRRQYIELNGQTSDEKTVIKGVPQGSILGSLLFIIFINDLFNVDINANLILYADDASVVCYADNFYELELVVNNVLNVINTWMCENGLKLNHNKCQYLVINLSSRQIPDLNINIDGNNIAKTDSLKILGLFFDERLAFVKHIQYLSHKINSRLKLFRRIREYIPIKEMNLLFKALVQPLLDYGITIYGFTYKTHFEKLEKLQRSAAKMITFSDHFNQNLYKRLNWLSFINRRHYFSSIFIYRCLHSIAPKECQTFFAVRVDIRSTRSTSNKELVLPIPGSVTFKNSMFYTGAQFFNSIDLSIREISLFKSFCSKLKLLLI